MAKGNTMDTIKQVADVLVLIGAIAWGFESLGYHLLDMIMLGSIATIIYGLVGLSGLYLIYDKYLNKK